MAGQLHLMLCCYSIQLIQLVIHRYQHMVPIYTNVHSIIYLEMESFIHTSTLLPEHQIMYSSNMTITTAGYVNIYTRPTASNFNNFNDFNNYQRHRDPYLQFIVLYYILQTQDKYYKCQDISRNNWKKFCILVIVNVNNSLKHCNGCDNTKWTGEQ